MPAYILSLVNQKGGVSKTTSCAHVAKALARKRQRVLAIDMDPQANLSQILGDTAPESVRNTIYSALQTNQPAPFSSAISATPDENIDLCYGSLEMAGLDIELRLNELEPASVLRRKIDSSVQEEYDYILLDNPPSLSMLTLNSLAASHFYIVPITAGDAFALSGVRQLTRVIEMVRTTNSDLQLLGALLTRYDGRLTICKSIDAQTRQSFGRHNVFATNIRNNTQVEQAIGLKKTVYEQDHRAPAAKDYLSLAKEIIERCKRLAPEASHGQTTEAAAS
ncbi:MAG: AAA family ATPase [Candidatus Latescibacteria bacterium]|nr:AAA family ATPase [Candidatus Latescibacterota bacterium]